MKKIRLQIFTISILFCLFSPRAYSQQVQIRVTHPATGQTKVILFFSKQPDFYYYMRPSPMALVLVMQGGLSPKQFKFKNEPHLNNVQVKNVSPEESNIILQLKGQPLIKVFTEDKNIFVLFYENELPEKPAEPDYNSLPEPENEIILDLPHKDLNNLHIRRIVLDAGHGGWDSGAAYGSAIEKDIVLNIALKSEQLLKKNSNLQVYLTRRGDYYLNLRERTLIANQYHADLFISIHANAAKNKSRRGVETYYCSETASDKMAAKVAEMENAVARREDVKILPQNYIDIEEILFKTERKIYWEDSRKICKKIQLGLCSEFVGNSDDVKSANFSVLRNAKMVAILVEVGYISNVTERNNLIQNLYQQKVAQKIFSILTKLAD